MGISARFRVDSVNAEGGSRVVECAEGDCTAPGPVTMPDSTQHGHWASTKVAETVEFSAIYSDDPDDPNYEWSEATPSGSITMRISNPDAWEYFKPGLVYGVGFQKIKNQP